MDPITGDIVVMPVAGRVAGAIVAEDFRTGYPFHSAANEPIQGIVSPARTINFSLTATAKGRFFCPTISASSRAG